jgi:hypothetical protein
MVIFVQFLLRLGFGLAVGMAITSPQTVSSGYFRNHLYVTLGLTTLAALVASEISPIVAALAAGAAALSYVGSVYWLYEAQRAGVVVLWLVAAFALAAALVGEGSLAAHSDDTGASFATLAAGAPPGADRIATPPAYPNQQRGAIPDLLRSISVVTSGLVLGVTMAAMLLGHWYLNSPGMELSPLRKLLGLMAAVVVAQMLLSATSLAGEQHVLESAARVSWWILVLLRWSFGLIGILALVVMAWKTLNIPNTQSATGILYVAVIGTFVGELAALLLSANSVYPL